MSSPVPSVTSLLNSTRDRLLASGLYLADPTIAERLWWVPDGRGHVLVYDPRVVDAHPNEASSETDFSDDTALPSEGSPDLTDTPPPKGAELSVIVRIDRDNFWLTSDGGYVEPTAICKELQEVKPSCTLTNPRMEPASTDFDSVLHMLRQLTKQCITTGYSCGKSLFANEKNKPPGFKVQHRLFERIETTVAGNNPDMPPSSSSTDDPFSFELWPLTRERHRKELLALKRNHRLCPVPAYDLADDLLHPTTYRHCLWGAIVEIHFTLSHWGIASSKRDVYGGLIQKICILVLPMTSPVTGMKRKLPLHLDTDDKPAKKGTHA
ncbi:hypothetical protein EDD15DRAFT_2368510 [Pisolithus albus]|nr:hypothetical protein EDD15DRAFT_2368510 [Pisolithus albus]